MLEELTPFMATGVHVYVADAQLSPSWHAALPCHEAYG